MFLEIKSLKWNPQEITNVFGISKICFSRTFPGLINFIPVFEENALHLKSTHFNQIEIKTKINLTCLLFHVNATVNMTLKSAVLIKIRPEQKNRNNKCYIHQYICILMGSRFRFLLFPVVFYKRNYLQVLEMPDKKCITHPAMQDNYVEIAGIPTRIQTLGKWIEEPFDSSKEKEIVLVITGNPGLPSFYTSFITSLYQNLNKELPVWIIGHAGHEEPDGKKRHAVPQLKGNEEKYDLNGQLNHKIEFLTKYIPDNVKIHLVGHSVGAWTILQLLKNRDIRDKVHHCYLLFPTIERMKISPAGQIFTERIERALWYSKIFYMLGFMPYAFRRYFLNYYVQKWNLPEAYLDAALKVANDRVLERILHMGRDQVENVYDLEVDWIKENKSILKFYYGQTDHWCPKNYFYELKEKIPDIDAELDELGMAHAFNVRKGPEMAFLCAQWIKSNPVKNLVDDTNTIQRNFDKKKEMAGRGRGHLLRQLLESEGQSAESDSGGPSNDSINRTTLGSSQSQSQLIRSDGSGRSTDSPKPVGRAQFMAILKQKCADTESDVGIFTDQGRSSSDPDKKEPAPVRARGRGMLLARVMQDRTADTESDSADVSKIASVMESVKLEPEVEKQAVQYRGGAGTTLSLSVNYIKMNMDPDKGVFEYMVDFQPSIGSKNVRFKLLNKLRELIGETKTFDGVTLYLPIKLPDRVTKRTVEDLKGEKYEVLITFRRQKKLSECVHLYNVLFDRIMHKLNFVRFNRKQFDPSKPVKIPHYKLEIWPGYVTAVDEHEDGVMLCLDVNFRVLNERTVLDLLKEAYSGSSQELFRRNFEQAVLGAVVITRYNNKTYRIDEILWDKNPMTTFKQADGSDITFCDYYKKHYNIEIKDKKQPLLLHTDTRRLSGGGTKDVQLCFIPEISYLTGLTEKMRSDFKVMKDVATCTRITPNQRVNSLRSFIKRVNENEITSAMLKGWGLTMAPDIMSLQGRQLEEEKIIFRNGKTITAGRGADFNRELTNNPVIEAINLENWLLIFTERDIRTADKFVDIIQRNARPMGIEVVAPVMHKLKNDSVSAYVEALRSQLSPKFQIVVLICPTARDDRYAAIKRLCCAELPIPSQVINAKTLANDAKNRSIVQKIMLQMNCKMGGTLWGIRIPFKNVMICGIDTHHDAGRMGSSVAAFVASLNESYTKWYSRANMQSKNEELLNGLTQSLRFALKEYKNVNHVLPERIIIFRDGVGDGQIEALKNYEIVQLKAAWKAENPNYDPQFTFIIVQKRINTRIMTFNGKEYVNPHPGTIVDHSITRKYLYDFFLVPQSVRQGTVSPTHYIVVDDTSQMKPDIVQRLAYKLCFMYYNWPGTVRVPACCQYAHKMAFLIGTHVKRNTADQLNDKLFYL
uniref:Lipid droplet-associated hydrolase n=1 Tax=Culicoides sonorensis TaxID=179676 RepID=A0A336M4G2_CULSO